MIDFNSSSGSAPSEATPILPGQTPAVPTPDPKMVVLVLQLLRLQRPDLTEAQLTAAIQRLSLLTAAPVATADPLAPPPAMPTFTPTTAGMAATDFVELRRAMHQAQAYHLRQLTPPTLREAVDKFIKVKASKGKAGKTLEYYKSLLGRFADWSGIGCLLENADPIGWLTAQTQLKDPDSYKAYFINLNAFFKWCVRRKLCPVNPCPRLRFNKAGQVKAKIVHFRLEDLVKLFEIAIRWRPSFIPILALHFFAGLRPSRETFELKWGDIDWDHKLIHLPKGLAKNRGARSIPMSPALIAWLSPFRSRSKQDRIAPNTYVDWKERRPYLLRWSEVTWPGADAPRHTAASAWLEWTGDRKASAELLGHGLGVQLRCYEFHSWEGWGRAYHHFFPPRGWTPHRDFDVVTQRGRQVPPPEAVVMTGVPTARAWAQFRTQLQPTTTHK